MYNRKAVFYELRFYGQLDADLPLRLEVNLIQVGADLARVVGLWKVDVNLEFLGVLRLSHELYLLFRFLANTRFEPDCLLYDK